MIGTGIVLVLFIVYIIIANILVLTAINEVFEKNQCDDFKNKKQEYLTIIEKYRSTNAEVYEKDYKIEPNPSFKAVFVCFRGIVDNWSGFVYDLSGEVEKINVADWDDPNIQNIKKLFLGDMFGCEKIEENWYLCSFT